MKDTFIYTSIALGIVLIISVTHVSYHGEYYFGISSYSKCLNSQTCGVSKYTEIPVDRFVAGILVGRLGNDMWIYSSIYGIAKKTGRIPIICGRKLYLKRIFSNLSLKLYPLRTFHMFDTNPGVLRLREKSPWFYDHKIIIRLNTTDVRYVVVRGFFQNLRYFREYLGDLKAQFLLQDIHKQKAYAFLQNLRLEISRKEKVKHETNVQTPVYNNIAVFVSVHVRRGNMLKVGFVKVPGPVYFENAMNYYRKRFGKNIAFVISTNDIFWSRNNLKGDDVYFTQNYKEETTELVFAIALSCNHTIMSVGTFGWWMGFLAGGDVIYFKDWIGGQTKRLYTADEHFPKYFKELQ